MKPVIAKLSWNKCSPPSTGSYLAWELATVGWLTLHSVFNVLTIGLENREASSYLLRILRFLDFTILGSLISPTILSALLCLCNLLLK